MSTDGVSYIIEINPGDQYYRYESTYLILVQSDSQINNRSSYNLVYYLESKPVLLQEGIPMFGELT